MGALAGICNALGAVNAAVLALGRWIGAVCMALMVIVILMQVVLRYGFAAALPWPEEASRFLMLWATGLMAPTALRRGGFVAIDMIVRLLPRLPAAVLAMAVLAVMVTVLWVAIRIGWSEVTGLGGRFETDSLRYPALWDLSVWQKVPKAWMMASLLTGVILMFSVVVELMLRNLVGALGGRDRLNAIPETVMLGAE